MFKMSTNGESESPPIIFKEADKVMESLESSEDKEFQLKNLLEEKQAYYEQLEQHNNDGNKSNARKRAHFTLLNDRVDTTDMHNTKFRDEAKQIYDSCNEAYQYINDIESEFEECEGKTGNLDTKLNDETNQYEKKIDELIKLLDQLTEKRSKKLESLEEEKKGALEERFDLEKQISDYENKEESLGIDDGDSELEMLENELKELQSKLSILDDEQCELNRNQKDCENDYEELAEKYHESKFVELENRFVKVESEVSQIIQNWETRQRTESELSNSALTLEDYEAKLNQEIQQTSKFWNDLDQNPYEGFSKIEQEIGKIQADIMERNGKYAEVKDSGLKCSEQIKQVDEEVEQSSSRVNQLSSELTEIENVFDNLKTSTYLSEEYDTMTRDVEKLCKEQGKLNEDAAKTTNEIEIIMTQLKKEKDKGYLELLAIENNNLMEVKKIEKDCAMADSSNLQEKAEYVEHESKELEEIKINIKDKERKLEKDQEDITVIIEEAERICKNFKMKRDELKKKLGSVSAPPPIYVKANDPKFAKPKTNEIPKKKIPQKPSTVVKRNWDSDSSMEAEEVKLSDVLKKKYRKVM